MMQIRHSVIATRGVGALASRVGAFVRRFFTLFNDARVLDSAAAAAFWMFLSLVPMGVVAAMIVVKFAMADVSVLSSIASDIPPDTRALLGNELGHVAAWHRGTVAPISTAVFVWLASSGVHAILDAFDATTRSSRPWWRKRVLACLICVGLSVGIGVFGALVGVLRHGAVAFALSALVHGPLRFVVALLVETVLIIALFRIGIARGGRARVRLWPGAIVAGVCHGALGYGYILYVRRLGSGGAYEAGLATIGVTLTATYLFMLSLLVGVAFDAVLAASSARTP
jgi:membrane protein